MDPGNGAPCMQSRDGLLYRPHMRLGERVAAGGASHAHWRSLQRMGMILENPEETTLVPGMRVWVDMKRRGKGWDHCLSLATDSQGLRKIPCTAGCRPRAAMLLTRVGWSRKLGVSPWEGPDPGGLGWPGLSSMAQLVSSSAPRTPFSGNRGSEKSCDLSKIAWEGWKGCIRQDKRVSPHPHPVATQFPFQRQGY